MMENFKSARYSSSLGRLSSSRISLVHLPKSCTKNSSRMPLALVAKEKGCHSFRAISGTQIL
jgi:hypothetical protein